MKREKGGPVMFNLRVRPTSGRTKVTKAALREVVKYIKENDAAPRGWEVAYIEWSHPKARGSSGWKRGDESDLGFLGRVLRKMGNVELRAAQVEVRATRQTKRLRKAADSAHRERVRELKLAVKARTAATKRKHRARAARARERWERYATKLQDETEAGAEFELAVNYKGRKR